MSKKKKMVEEFNLHEDIIVQILLRLPVKPLIKFSIVSKRWHFIIIFNPEFAKAHLRLALEKRTLQQRVLIETYFAKGRRTLPSRFQSFKDCASPVINITYPTDENNAEDSVFVQASCNGLVFLCDARDDGFKKLSVWNPSTGFCRSIPSPEYARQDSYVYGFGQATTTGEYKIVFGVPDEFYIYTLKAGYYNWKTIDRPRVTFPSWKDHLGTYSNGALHWLMSLDPEVIYAFDLAEEELREMRLPGLIRNEDKERKRLNFVTDVMSGYFCLLSMAEYRYCEVWAMKEYGVDESWIKLFQFEIANVIRPHSSSWCLCYLSECGTAVIQHDWSNELIQIECCRGKKVIRTGRYKVKKKPRYETYLRTTLYDETLVSVPE